MKKKDSARERRARAERDERSRSAERDQEKPAQNGDELEQEPDEIADRASLVGEERLDRSALDIFLTSMIGGAEVSLGGLGAMVIVGSALETFSSLPFSAALALGGLAFPIGFLFVIIGRSELFTENFLIPVIAVFNGDRPPTLLAKLWGLSWSGNMLGCAGMAVLLSVPKALGSSILLGYHDYAAHKLELPLLGLIASAILAGAVMTALTWVLVTVRETLARMAIIFGAGYLLFAANLSHSIVGASVLFVGFWGTQHSLIEVASWLLVATIGNLVGGVGLVTLFRFVQAKEKENH